MFCTLAPPNIIFQIPDVPSRSPMSSQVAEETPTLYGNARTARRVHHYLLRVRPVSVPTTYRHRCLFDRSSSTERIQRDDQSASSCIRPQLAAQEAKYDRIGLPGVRVYRVPAGRKLMDCRRAVDERIEGILFRQR